MTVHGGDVWQVAETEGIEVESLLDFSANINPRGLPPKARERLARDAANPHLLKLYPDPSARVLRDALSRQLDVPPEAIVIGPGAEALLSPALRAINPRRAIVPIPAFSEYARVCAQNDVERGTPAQIGNAPYDVIFLNNPRNPTGALLERDEVLRIIESAPATLMDEAFIDYAPHASVTRDAASRANLIVVRSLTKFYGCPALRAGYAVTHPDTARAMASFLPTWPVTQFAIDALAIAVEDRDYADAVLKENTCEREILRRNLEALGLTVFPSAANFLLLELRPDMPRSSELRARLIGRHRILIRNCDSYEGLAPGRHVRVAVRSREDNLRMVKALAGELKI